MKNKIANWKDSRIILTPARTLRQYTQTYNPDDARMTHEPIKVDYKKTREESKSRITSHTEQIMKPSETLRTVETHNGINDTGVEEFIKSVEIARTRVSDTASLLRMIVTEKITNRAKQSIQFCQITTYEELYKTLRTRVSIPITVSGNRNKMQNIKQGTNETVQSYSNRFRQALNELEYAVQAKHSNPITRNIALEEENKEAIRFYIYNLRTDLAQYIIPMRPTPLIEPQQEASNMKIWLKETSTKIVTHQPSHRPAINKGPIRTSHTPTPNFL